MSDQSKAPEGFDIYEEMTLQINGEKFKLMVYEKDSCRYCTFGTKNLSGEWEIAPFPEAMLTNRDIWNRVVIQVNQSGIPLVQFPEQKSRLM